MRKMKTKLEQCVTNCKRITLFAFIPNLKLHAICSYQIMALMSTLLKHYKTNIYNFQWMSKKVFYFIVKPFSLPIPMMLANEIKKITNNMNCYNLYFDCVCVQVSVCKTHYIQMKLQTMKMRTEGKMA